ncbi:MAG TPA: 3-deoxy-8-phosphooctulonate synthase [Planctomycetota bacterium]|nr:3-deoxy-8-phosphooctulonate synthase [Planctomycetota bacterium]
MKRTNIVDIGGVKIGGDNPLALIAGPCVIESEDHARYIAGDLKAMAGELGLPFIFKASYDKANRTSISGFRGPGLKDGLAILNRIARDFSVPVMSDVHAVHEVSEASDALDAVQIPALLCRQTDLLIEAGSCGKPVNIKKGQFMAPWDMANAIEKVMSTGNSQVLLTERGACFGYNNLVVDMRSLHVMRETGCPVVFDGTHSVQLPGGQGRSSGGQREYVPLLSRAAVAAGCDALFLEVHDNPDKARCDGPNMLALARLRPLLLAVREIDALVRLRELE